MTLPLSRRSVLGAAAALLPARFVGAAEPAEFAPGRPLPWINWAGNQWCRPAHRAAPASEDELVSVLKSAPGVVRAAGASHSFSAVVPTDDTLVATDLLSGVIRHDEPACQAEIWAGTRMHQLGPMLESIGQALPNQPDMDYLSMGGAIASSAHATGAAFGSMSSYVAGLTLATPSGELIECGADRHPEIFQAARTAIGSLGVVSRLVLRNLPAFRLVEVNRVEKTEEVIEDLPARLAGHRHFEFLPLPHSSYCATVATDLAGPGDVASGEDDPQAVSLLRHIYDVTRWSSAVYDAVLTRFMAGSASTVRVGPAHEVFPHVRVVRFREMEYSVPAEAGPACLREILNTIRERRIPVCFPLECRFVKGDDIWLSMFEGRDSCSISVHQFLDLDHTAYFAAIEPIFWKYDGRPHWGKLHTLDARRLAALYPRHWQDFQEVRRTLDPKGRMMNTHLKQIFGA